MGIQRRASRLRPGLPGRAFLAASLALAASAAGALDLGLSAGAWSFSRPVSAARAEEGREIEPGLYARAGAIAGIASRLELEAFAVGSLAPAPGRELFLGAEATLPALGSREKSYFNLFASLGYLRALRLEGGLEPAGGYLSLRVSPLAIGNPSYGRRDRIFSVGALYELGSGEVSLTWSVLTFDFF
ncbi:MAG TPA: hypothetical protein PLB91_02135 [Spirochaetales bacterium]|nr:hypothetical protein [Spirochaetales bacterium]HRY53159.1 hypothetical protein [Spirochaetia bacterium]HRZ63300.1 hypothetical protein [Spirochaetia bacterium]